MLANYATAEVAKRERFEFWREAVCDVYVKLGCDAEERHDFRGHLQVERFSEISISHVGGSAHEAVRRERDISRSDSSDFLLSLQLQNHSRLSQRAATTILRPMDFALYSSSDPYRLSLSEGFSQIVLQFPKRKLLSRLPDAEMLTASRVDGQLGLGPMVARNIVELSRVMSEQLPAAQVLAQETLLDMIAMALASNVQTAVHLSHPEQHILMRARSFVQSNLTDESLNRKRVAAAVGVSVRRLNEVFALEGQSISGFIRHARLEQVSADLVDPRFAAQRIGELSCKWGFTNSQHFSKLFRNTYGRSPRDFRREGANSARLPSGA